MLYMTVLLVWLHCLFLTQVHFVLKELVRKSIAETQVSSLLLMPLFSEDSNRFMHAELFLAFSLSG